MDLKLTGYDMDITSGNVSWVNGIEAIAQHVKMRLRTWLGETVYDVTAGIPYLQVVFERGTSINSIRFILEQKVRATPGVTGVYLLPEFDRATGVLTVTGKIKAIDGEIDFTETVTPGAL